MGSRHHPMASPPLLLLLFLLLLSSLPGGYPDLAGDRDALLSLRSAVARALPWNASASPCTWMGVSCSAGRVTSLRLPGSGLLGPIPENTISNLTALQTLSLRFNAISSPLPSDFSSLVSLRNLYLQNNRLSGDFPQPVLALANLVRLDLSFNNLSGEIPVGLDNLTHLKTLFLQENSFSDEIPDLDLPRLAQFNVSFNELNGSIPAHLATLPASSFLGMALCGGPLSPCASPISPALAPSPGGGTGGGGNNPSGGGGGGGSKLSGGAIAGIAVGSAAGLLILVVILLLLCRRKRGESKTRAAPKPPTAVVGTGGGWSSAPVSAESTASAAAVKAEKRLVFFGANGGRGDFDLEDLLRASAEVLGKGTFGTAYKAVLEMGPVVAVKRLKDVSMPESEFRQRIEAIGAMRHPNLVPLKAYYFSKDEKLLVYDYMHMGSLSSLLHGHRGSGRTPLDWETRSRIALAAARGIEYIHSTNPGASHGNIKSSNILLAKSLEASVSDHGLAQLIGSPSSPPRVVGYRAPEVTDLRSVSQKADVYSFGVLLLELVTGKAPAQALLNEDGVDLPRWVQSVVQEEWPAEVFDVELLGHQNAEEEMVQLLQLAIDCVDQYPHRRPSMAEVVVRIQDIRRSSRGPPPEEIQQQQQQPHSIDDADNHSSGRTHSIDGS